MFSQGSGEKQLAEQSMGGRHTRVTPAPHLPSPLKRYHVDSPGMRLEPHACNRNRTLSPQASPMVELFVPSREPVTGNTEPMVSGSQAGRVGTTWRLGLGPGP